MTHTPPVLVRLNEIYRTARKAKFAYGSGNHVDFLRLVRELDVHMEAIHAEIKQEEVT